MRRGARSCWAASADQRPGPEHQEYVETAGELQAGARGVAAPVLGLDGLEASVGIVTLGDLDAAAVGPLVVGAAARVASRLS